MFRSYPGRALVWVLQIVFVAGFLSAVISVGGVFVLMRDIGLFSDNNQALKVIQQYRTPDNSVVFDKNGEKIGEFFTNYQVYVPYREIPADLIKALLAIEDRNFFYHKGFDPKGLMRAVVNYLRSGHADQGASTLTQQVVRHFLLTKERSMARKVQEIILSLKLEKTMPKERILEIYVNTMFLGNGSYGVGSAAQRYFGKPISQLRTHELALIAGLFQSPSRYNPTKFPERAKKRQRLVLKAMKNAGYLTESKTKQLLEAPLIYTEYVPLNTAVAPYFLDYIKAETEKITSRLEISTLGRGLRIYTSLDTALNTLATDTIKNEDARLDAVGKSMAQGVRPDGSPVSRIEASMLVVDPNSGDVLAMVGGRDYGKSQYNRTTQSMRSPGSTFKPVVYSLALSKESKWNDIVYVSPIMVGNYRPKGSKSDFLSETTLYRAFYKSMNTPAVELGEKLGLPNVLEHAKQLGVQSPLKNEVGTLLGGSDVNMFDMARMYSTFAAEGNQTELQSITRIEDRSGRILYQAKPLEKRKVSIMRPEIAYLMTEGMRGVLKHGTGAQSSHLAPFAVGKTGTSNEAADNWFCGYTPDLVAVVWVGTDDHSAMPGDSAGGTLALPIWDRFMSEAIKTRKSRSFRRPSGIVSAIVHPQYGTKSRSGVEMFFLQGTEPTESASSLEQIPTEGNYRGIFGHH